MLVYLWEPVEERTVGEPAKPGSFGKRPLKLTLKWWLVHYEKQLLAVKLIIYYLLPKLCADMLWI